MKNIVPVFVATAICHLALAQSTIESIPNNKLINGSYVSNPDGILRQETISQIDSILSTLEATTTVQVAVVAVNSIGDVDLFEFSQNLFNTWGIGHKSNNNGLLILLVKDAHEVRFHTGDGIEGTLPDATCKKIQRDYMVPEFKNGNYDEGIRSGVIEVTKILTDPNYAKELKADESEDVNVVGSWLALLIFFAVVVIPALLIAYFVKKGNGSFKNDKTRSGSLYKEMQITKATWWILYGIIPTIVMLYFNLSDNENAFGTAVIVLYLYLITMVFFRLWRMGRVISRLKNAGNYYQIVEFIRSSQWYWFFMGLFFPIPFFPYFFYHLVRKKLYRNHPRNCSECQGKMIKLGEKEDDAFLSTRQVMEEQLGSIDYDVWQCQQCSATEEWNYPNRSSKYKECPSCRTHAYYLVGRKTIKSATYSSSGKGEETHSCKFCGKSKTSTYTIAQLERSSSSSSSGFSSSSSSGSSWGGGSSSGGGASSSW